MRRILSLILLLVLLSVSVCSHAETMEEYAAARFRGRKIVGGAVIISRNGETLFSTTYGYKNARKNQPVTLDTCFRIASVTKLVSAVGLMQLIEEKGISLETPVKDIVGFQVINPAFPDTPITIRQVMSHTSGLVQTQYYFPNWEKLPRENRYFSVKNAPGAKYTYSNLNGGLVGAMIEALSGQSVNSYMQENVFEPLGINAAYHPALLKDQSDVADMMTKAGGLSTSASRAIANIKDYTDTCEPRAHTNITSGRLYISANGLNRIISMLQRGGELDGVRILKKETIEQMMLPQHTVEGSSVVGESPYGLCLYREENMPGGTWYGHQGRYDGLTSNIYFQPDTGLSVAVIANGYEGHAVDDIVTIARVFMERAQEYLD